MVYNKMLVFNVNDKMLTEEEYGEYVHGVGQETMCFL